MGYKAVCCAPSNILITLHLEEGCSLNRGVKCSRPMIPGHSMLPLSLASLRSTDNTRF